MSRGVGCKKRRQENEPHKKTIQIAYLAIFILAAGMAAFLNYRNFEQKRDSYYTRLQDELSTAYGVTAFANQETARIVFDTFIKKPEILELYKQANSADEDVRNATRRQLLEKFGLLYERLKARNVRQLHFHLPNSESFLRFHRPGKYGDSLKGVRYSVDKANAELVAVSGFEEGRIFNGFRNVFPLIHNDEHLGSVEISMEFDAIRQRMEQQFHNKYTFIIQREVVEKKVFGDMRRKYYTPSDLSDDYLYERPYVVDDTLRAINALLKPKIQERLKTGEGFAVEAKAANTARLAVFFSVKNVQGQHVAYIVSYNDDATISGYYSEFVVTLAASIAGLLIIVALLYLLTNAFRSLRAEKVTLQQEREQFHRFMNASPSLTFIKDANFRYLFADKQTADFFGKSIYDILGKTDQEIAEEEKIAQCISSDRKALESDTVITDEEKLGDQIYGVVKFPLTLPGGEKGIGGIMTDITGRKQVEETKKYRTRIHEMFLSMSLKFINIPLADVNKTINYTLEKLGRFVYADRSYIFDYDWDKDICINTFEWCAEGIPPQIDELQKVPLSMVSDWVKTHKQLKSMNIPDVFALPENSGLRQILEPQEIKSFITIPLIKGHQVFGFIGFDSVKEHHTFSSEEEELLLFFGQLLVNITERKRAEQQLHNEREKLFVTMQSIGDGVITTDTEGRVTFINGVAEELTGWNQEKAAGQILSEIFNIINEKTGLTCENPVNKVLVSGKIISLANHTALIARDGIQRSIADSGAPILDPEGKIIGVVLVFRDVTQEKKREEELLKIKKLESVGGLAGGIAHDFNNILMAILGNINLADIYIGKDHKAHRLLQEAEKASVRAKDLTQQLLTFSKGGDP
ncbi:MAG: PAS domain-containing protein, partial [Thermodesulfobacteriota bacterium]|nr:PAS domain-containing protein [Thermodesulfobacteriota bacterium]